MENLDVVMLAMDEICDEGYNAPDFILNSFQIDHMIPNSSK